MYNTRGSTPLSYLLFFAVFSSGEATPRSAYLIDPIVSQHTQTLRLPEASRQIETELTVIRLVPSKAHIYTFCDLGVWPLRHLAPTRSALSCPTSTTLRLLQLLIRHLFILSRFSVHSPSEASTVVGGNPDFNHRSLSSNRTSRLRPSAIMFSQVMSPLTFRRPTSNNSCRRNPSRPSP